jgi:hypothetical protein
MGLASCLSSPPTCTSAALWGTTTSSTLGTTDICVATAGGITAPDDQCCAVAGAGKCSSGMHVYQQGKDPVLAPAQICIQVCLRGLTHWSIACVRGFVQVKPALPAEELQA